MHLPTAAFDIGYGFVKIITGKENNQFQTVQFPSQAQPTYLEDSHDGIFTKTDVAFVNIEGQQYACGPDVERHQSLNHARVLTNDYIYSAQYMALNYAAMVYTKAAHIETLVVGLPVDLLDKHRNTVIKLLEGTHVINNKTTVSIERVIVVAQPLGGLVYAQQYENLILDPEKEYLVIDPGYYTFDWFAMKNMRRTKPICGHCAGGMSVILNNMAMTISNEFNIDYQEIEAIDEGLRRNELHIHEKKVNLTKHLKLAESRIIEAIQIMQNKIGNHRTFGEVLLVGGAAKYYSPLIKQRLGIKAVRFIDDSMFANAKGFYTLGESIPINKGDNAA